MEEQVPRWQMVAEEAFAISGRGIAVVGSFRGTSRPGDRAVVRTNGRPTLVERVSFEFLDRVDVDGRSDGRLAILLRGQTPHDVPPGSVIQSED